MVTEPEAKERYQIQGALGRIANTQNLDQRGHIHAAIDILNVQEAINNSFLSDSKLQGAGLLPSELEIPALGILNIHKSIPGGLINGEVIQPTPVEESTDEQVPHDQHNVEEHEQPEHEHQLDRHQGYDEHDTALSKHSLRREEMEDFGKDFMEVKQHHTTEPDRPPQGESHEEGYGMGH